MIDGLDDESDMASLPSGRSTDGIDESFLNNFRSMGTSSRDDLIRQFKSLISADISDEHCEFFLDMASWNIQNALGIYFDTNVPPVQQPLSLVPAAPAHSPNRSGPKSLLTPELDWDAALLDESRPSPLICENKQQEIQATPGEKVTSTWLIRNGSDAPYACGLHLLPMAAADGFPLVPIPEPIGPNQTVAVFTEVTVHYLPGITYSVFWHVADSQSRLLSEPLTLRIKVLPERCNGDAMDS